MTSDFPWLSGDVFRLTSYGVTFLSWLDLLSVALPFLISIPKKKLQITSKLLTKGLRYHKLRKTFRKIFRSYCELLFKFGEISFQENVLKESVTGSSTVI